MEHKYKNPLRRTVLFSCFLFTVIISCLLGTLGFLIYQKDMIGRYQKYAGDAVQFLARRIDGDDLAECIRTGEKSEKYEELQLLGNDLKEAYSLEFIYIILPLKEDPPDNMMDVYAAYTAAGKAAGTDGLTDLGNLTGDAYPPEVARQYMARMDHNPEVTYFRNDTDFGNIYTAIRPIFDSNGNPIAVLCADILINEIFSAAWDYVLVSGAAAVLGGAVLLFFMNLWFGRRIIDPISRLEQVAVKFEEKCRSRLDVAELTIEDPGIKTGDEIEALSGTIASMVEDVQSYAKDLLTADKEINNLKDHVLKMDALAYRDSLTGAGNKASYEKIKARLDFDIISGGAEFAVIMADLNFLKKINDVYGHDMGNIYIKKMYTLLSDVFLESPVFRIGGDEFVIIVEGRELEECEALIAVLKRRMEKITADKSLEPWERISTAIGYSVFVPNQDQDVDTVFRRADAAMYENKKQMHAVRE